MTDLSDLDRRCAEAGIETRYVDDWQRVRTLSPDTKRALLAALGPDAGAAAAPAAPRASGRCNLPPALQGQGRTWGIAAQLYGLRSARNWGIGDFSDLARLVELAAGLGGGAVGLNPLHALFPGQPERASPYAGSSRRFLNALYIDVESVADFAECPEAREMVAAPPFRERLGAARAAALVDYAGVAALKLPVLELLHRSFQARHAKPGAEGPRGRAFLGFLAERGGALERHAAFEALAERFSRTGGGDWRSWPEAYRRPDSPEVARFTVDNRDRVQFFAYMQWQADLQLQAAAERGRTLGLPVGLYMDLAIGTAGDGADTWADQDVLVDRVTVGAPPERWNPTGQDWGLLPFHPGRLRDLAFAPFAEVLAANMRHAGALRLDHVLGLMRLYWIPRGRPPDQGGYVRYPLAELVGVLADESRRHKCVVVGEDLGTVPEGIRERLAEAGILSYRVLYFERTADGGFLSPAAYPSLAVATVTTHDLPTLAGYWTGHDLDVRARLGLFASPDLEREARADRDRDRRALAEALRKEGLLGGDPPVPEAPDEALVEAIYRFVGGTPSKLLMVHLEDVLLDKEQPNVPATPDAPPNWRRKLGVTLEELAREPRLWRIASALGELRSTKVAG